MSKEPKNLEQRDGFQSKWGFILACIGSAVGMGNIWRFPIMVQKYGGMTFLLPYFIFVILIGSTGVIEEFALGRRAAAGPVGAFGMCTKERTGSDKSGKAIGAIPIIGALMLAIGYTVVLGWIFKYTFMSLSGSLFSLGTDMGAIGGTFGMTAPEAETLPEALKAMASAGFFGIGNGVWQIVALVVSLAIMVMGVAGGIEKANKVMMPVCSALSSCNRHHRNAARRIQGYGRSDPNQFDLFKPPDLCGYFAFGRGVLSPGLLQRNGSVIH